MKRLIELETDEDFAEYREILEKARNGHTVGTLKQVMHNPETDQYSYIDLQQNTAESSAVVQVNENYFYVTLQRQTRTDVRKIRNMWNTMLSRGTLQFSKGLANDYLLTIDVGYTDFDKGIAYVLSAVQPIFVTNEGDMDLTFVFPIENVRCAKEEISVYDIDYEVAMRNESGDKAYAFDFDEDEDEFEETDADENEEFLNNDSFTGV